VREVQCTLNKKNYAHVFTQNEMNQHGEKWGDRSIESVNTMLKNMNRKIIEYTLYTSSGFLYIYISLISVGSYNRELCYLNLQI
jgi:hypothetical protein